MKTLIIAALLALAAPAWAADAHGHAHKPQHGGIVAEAASMEFELVAQAEVIVLHVRDHQGKPLPTEGGSGKITVLSGSSKTEAALAPAGSGKLQARGSFVVAAGSKFVAAVTLPGKKAVNLRFAMK